MNLYEYKKQTKTLVATLVVDIFEYISQIGKALTNTIRINDDDDVDVSEAFQAM